MVIGTRSFLASPLPVLRDARGAKITGEDTWATWNSARTRFRRTARFCDPPRSSTPLFRGRHWERDGIIPDIHAYAEWDTFYFETDPSIAAALELLGHR